MSSVSLEHRNLKKRGRQDVALRSTGWALCHHTGAQPRACDPDRRGGPAGAARTVREPGRHSAQKEKSKRDMERSESPEAESETE